MSRFSMERLARGTVAPGRGPFGAMLLVMAALLTACSGGSGGGGGGSGEQKYDAAFTSSCPGSAGVPYLCAASLEKVSGSSWNLKFHVHGLGALDSIKAFSFDVNCDADVVLAIGGEVDTSGESFYSNPIGGVNLAEANQDRTSVVVAQEGGGASVHEEGALLTVQLQAVAEGNSDVSITNLRAAGTDAQGFPVEINGLSTAGGNIVLTLK